MKERYPIVREGGEQIPGAGSIIKISQVVTSPDSADYFVEAFSNKAKKFGKAMRESSQAVLQEIKAFRDEVYLKSTQSGDIWSGKVTTFTDFLNRAENRAKLVASVIKDQVKGAVKMDVALSEASELIRGFSSEGKNLAKEVGTEFDKLLNSWFAKHQIISKGSVIYEGTDKGQIRRDSQGNPILANPSTVKTLLQGFQQYLKGLGIQATIKQHKYPEQKPEMAIEARKSAEKTSKAEVGQRSPSTKQSGNDGPKGP